MTDRYRDTHGEWRGQYDDFNFEGCCGSAPRGTHLDTCVMFPPTRPRCGVVLEGDRLDHEQDSLDSFGRPWLPSGDLPAENHRELPLLGPDWDEITAGRRP